MGSNIYSDKNKLNDTLIKAIFNRTGSNSLDPVSLNLKVVKNIVKMAKDLNMSVLAEGVESKSEYEILSKLNCDMIQGYYFSKPLPQNEIMDFIEKGVQTK